MINNIPGPMEKILMPIFFTFLKKERPESVKILEHLLSLTDFRTPSELFPDARSMKRKIIMHVGPTNSGKTHAALKAFSESQAAVYLGPLRLLAQEVYERMNKAGTACNLLTGEERKESDGVSRWSCTVEMAPLNRPLEVAVIDEIQMIADRDRGWAWTFALLGLQAKEIHVCGEPSAVDLVKNIAKITGDSVEVSQYYP